MAQVLAGVASISGGSPLGARGRKLWHHEIQMYSVWQRQMYTFWSLTRQACQLDRVFYIFTLGLRGFVVAIGTDLELEKSHVSKLRNKCQILPTWKQLQICKLCAILKPRLETKISVPHVPSQAFPCASGRCYCWLLSWEPVSMQWFHCCFLPRDTTLTVSCFFITG